MLSPLSPPRRHADDAADDAIAADDAAATTRCRCLLPQPLILIILLRAMFFTLRHYFVAMLITPLLTSPYAAFTAHTLMLICYAPAITAFHDAGC